MRVLLFQLLINIAAAFHIGQGTRYAGSNGSRVLSLARQSRRFVPDVSLEPRHEDKSCYTLAQQIIAVRGKSTASKIQLDAKVRILLFCFLTRFC